MKSLKAAIFDLDGVIVDTAKYHFFAWKRLAAELGFEFTEADNERQKGVSRNESLEILLEVGKLHFDEAKKEELAAKKNSWYVEYISNIMPSELLPGAVELIKELRNMRIKIGLASASKNAQLILERLDITNLFDAVVDGHCVSKAKPDPEVFLTAARLLHADPDKCIVFEDAQAGIEAVCRAGMHAVGIGNKDKLCEADYIIYGFEGLNADTVIKMIGGI